MVIQHAVAADVRAELRFAGMLLCAPWLGFETEHVHSRGARVRYIARMTSKPCMT
jgi:hypothetical protein